MSKQKRQEKIIALVEAQEIGTQEELAKALIDAGYPVTQATVSRDIRELKLTKVPTGKGAQRYVVLRNSENHLSGKYIMVLREGLISVDSAQNILVLKTVAGMAMAVAAALDAMQFHEIVGSIAGDDTIMAAVRTVEDTGAVMDKIRTLCGL